MRRASGHQAVQRAADGRPPAVPCHRSGERCSARSQSAVQELIAIFVIASSACCVSAGGQNAYISLRRRTATKPQPAASSDITIRPHSLRVGMAVALPAVAGELTVSVQVAVGGFNGLGPTRYNQVFGWAGSSGCRTLPPQLPRTVAPGADGGGVMAQVCWAEGIGKSVQVMVNAPGGLLTVLTVAHWA